jgi:hypothetical protein
MRAISRAAKQGTPHFIVVAVEEVSLSANAFHDLTAGCIDTGLPAGRRYFGQSDKPLVETAIVHHARWVIFTEIRCYFAISHPVRRLRTDQNEQ